MLTSPFLPRSGGAFFSVGKSLVNFWQKSRSAGGTLLLATLLVTYLAVGKLSGIALQPRVMIALAAMTIAHGGWVIAGRCRSLVPGSAASGDRSDRLASLLDIVMLAGLLAALSLGLANYLLGFQGYLEIIPGGEEMQLGPNLQLIDQGRLSQPRAFNHAVRGTEIVRGSTGRKAALRLQLRTGSRAEELLLPVGKPRYREGLRLAYQGDGYRVMLSVLRASHDYLAAPLTLRPLPGSRLYGARLDLTEPGASGEVTLDPDTGVMSAVVRRNGLREFAGPLQTGEVVRGGEMRLQVTSTSHFGRVLVQHRNYRGQTLAAIALFLAAGVGRLVLRKTSTAASARQ